MVAGNDLNTLPVDRGWAWAVAGGGFIAYILVGSSVQVRTLLFLEILQLFNTSFTTGSLVFMFTAIASSFSSVLVTNYVMPKLTERGCLIVGGIAASALSMGAAFAPNIGVFIAISSAKGIVSGLNVVPAMALIPRYFKRYRSRASVIPFCGGSAVNIIGPFVIKAVREEYWNQGMLHSPVCGRASLLGSRSATAASKCIQIPS
ncbi:unnamed protein product [Candidula unifasciata]|uniref:Uncharacterized protein n=1 Tax=Candidula unifasciata TaxID=100452 RepID=A0A8S3YZ56_9EUPU|nr:unnamed protein product [Candidula unifasciata]